ncbi:MAG: hypothetical protein ACJAYU_000240 [Bradymonadia bacterium]|jgi:hypothetical protein
MDTTRPLLIFALALLSSVSACGDDDTDDSSPADAADLGSADTPAVEDAASDPALDVAADVTDATDGPTVPFSEGPYGTGFRDLVGGFSLTTLDGPWSFRDAWSGYESFIFLMYTDDPLRSQGTRDFLEGYWFPGGSAEGEIRALIEASPSDVHYFFLSLDDDAESDVNRMKTDVDAVLATVDEATRAEWEARFHFVTEPVSAAGGWLQDFMADQGRLWFGIDMFQRVRQLGMTTDILTDSTRLHLIAHEATYFSFERRREDELSAVEWDRVRLIDNESVRSSRFRATMPAAIESYDTLYVDLGAYCTDHLEENCHEWDRNSNLTICDMATTENTLGEASCQPRVAEVVEVIEELGSCRVPVTCTATEDCDAEAEACVGYVAPSEGVDELPGTCVPTEPEGVCAIDEDCAETEVCLGYVARVEPAAEILAETMDCACQPPSGEEVASTQTCNGEGTGFNDCSCGCPHEIAGWITTYRREGRWVTDITPMLSTLQRGGEFEFNLDAGERLDVTLDLMFANTGVGERPREYTFLQGGGGFNENYNEGRDLYRFEVPDWATRAEVVAFTTGHGFGRAAGNCAEFCNHTHHWEVNNRVEYLQQFPEANERDACLRTVDQGVIPNQFGTWPFGRSGWCPGWDVKPWRADITESLRDGENTLRYQGLYRGREWEPDAAGGNIRMWSYLVFYGP